MSLDYREREKEFADRKSETDAVQAAVELERCQAAENFAKLERLLKMPEFSWFMETYVAPKVKEQESIALSPDSSDLECKVARHLREFAMTIMGIAEWQRDYWKNKAKA